MKDVNCRNWSCKFSFGRRGSQQFCSELTELTGAGYQCKLNPRRAAPMPPHQRRGCSGAGSCGEGNGGHLNRVLPPSTLNSVCSFCGGCRSSSSLLNPSFRSRDLLATALPPLRWPTKEIMPQWPSGRS